MIGIFTFDAPMYCDKNGIYCNTTVTNEILSRFFVVVDKIYLLMRTEHISQTYEERHLLKLELGDKIEVVELPNPNTIKNFLFNRKAKNIIRNYLQKSDMAFLRIPSIYSNMAAKECLKMNKPYLVEVGGCAWDSYFNHSLLGRFIAPFLYFSQKKTVANASFATYVTKRWLQSRYPTIGEQVVASNVYLDFFDDENIEKRIMRYKTSRPKQYRIGTIASVDVRYKGQEYIIRAIAILKSKGVIVHYDLVGAGDSSRLSTLANGLGVKDQVHFKGVKKHSDIWEWLDTIDIYAQPSKQEGLPRAVIEAMNRGCLAIGSNVAGIPELLEDDMIFRANDVSKICDIITKLINEEDHEYRIRRNYAVTAEFNIDVLEERRTKIFNSYKDMINNYFQC